MKKEFIIAVAIIVGTVFGAGILGLPYVFAKSGFLIGLLYLIVIGIAATLMTLYTGEITLRTKKFLQLPGLTEFYLNKKTGYFVVLLQVVGIYGALIAYLSGISTSMQNLFGGNQLVYSTVFFLIFSVLVYKGLKSVSISELVLSGLKITIVIVISLIILPGVNINNLNKINIGELFSPYGVILFAFLGYTVMPEIEEILKKDKKSIKKAVVVAMLICFGIYLLFSVVFVGNFGLNLGEIAINNLTGLIKYFGEAFVIFTLTTPFLALSLVLKDTFMHDYKINKKISWFLACCIPYLIVLSGSLSFIRAISISGGIVGSLTGIMICMVLLKSRKKGNCKPEYIVGGGKIPVYIISLIFLAGFIFEVISLIK